MTARDLLAGEGNEVNLVREVRELRRLVNMLMSQRMTFEENTEVLRIWDGLSIEDDFLSFADQSELTIAAGVITVTGSRHTIDTQSDDATDDLDTINGGLEGDILIIKAKNLAHTVVCKDSTDNLRLAGDFSLDGLQDTLVLIKRDVVWDEVSRSDNS